MSAELPRESEGNALAGRFLLVGPFELVGRRRIVDGIVQSISTDCTALAALRSFSVFLRSFACRRISFRDIVGWRAALERTPAAARAHATQYGCCFRPNEYTRHSAQKLFAQFLHVSTASSKPCRSHRRSMTLNPPPRVGVYRTTVTGSCLLPFTMFDPFADILYGSRTI